MTDRGSKLHFDEASHTYTYLPTGEQFVSGTTFIHHFFPAFDGSAVVDKMMSSPKWKTHKYYGMTKDEILALWDKEKNLASAQGTRMHACIENDLLGNKVDWKGLETEKSQYEVVKARLAKSGWRPYKMEMRIYSEKAKIAGTLDCLMVNDDNEYLLIDWKRCKELKTSNMWENAYAPVSHHPNCNYIQYSLQLNLYKYILEHHYDIKVKHMWLCSFHRNQRKEIVHMIPEMRSEIRRMIRHFKKSVTNAH
jgi:ATP-dependent exoDNAse (exonuclease V) beta subunit